MNKFLYAMNFSFEKMCHEIDRILNMTCYGEEEERIIFFVVGTCLHWILDYSERITVKEQDKELLSAFRCANNRLKHSLEIKRITEETGGFEFPIEFPFESSKREVVWSMLSEDKVYESQKKNYKKYLERKDVIMSCERVIELLKAY